MGVDYSKQIIKVSLLLSSGCWIALCIIVDYGKQIIKVSLLLWSICSV